MKRERRIFTPEDRLSIIQEGDREGTTATLRKYSLAPPAICQMEEKVPLQRDGRFKVFLSPCGSGTAGIGRRERAVKADHCPSGLGNRSEVRAFKKNAHPSQDKKMIVSQFKHIAPASPLLSWENLPASVYYYRNKQGKRGARPSTHTFKLDGSMIENQVVIEQIKDILSQEFCCYGY